MVAHQSNPIPESQSLFRNAAPAPRRGQSRSAACPDQNVGVFRAGTVHPNMLHRPPRQLKDTGANKFDNGEQAKSGNRGREMLPGCSPQGEARSMPIQNPNESY